jgi:hypothetical protein
VERPIISEAKFQELVRYFSADLTATQIAGFAELSRITVNHYLMKVRKLIHAYCTEIQQCDESYSGSRQVKGAAGTMAATSSMSC